MRYLILEDEPLAARKLREAVAEERPEWECLDVLESVARARKDWYALNPDLVFVDIHLADGLSFQIFEEIQTQTPLIFTTAYDRYALKAFELNSIDYLLKPVQKEELQRALQKLDARSQIMKSAEKDWKKVMADYQPKYKERFMVSTGERVKSLKTGEIAFFYASGKHCFITNFEGNEYIIDQTLQNLHEILNPRQFFQINRKFIVNIEAIVEMIPYSKSRLKLVTQPSTPEEAIVSVDRSPRFKEWAGG